MRVGIAHHLGWAIAVTATPTHEVVDRRRLELVAEDLPAAPVHHLGGPHAFHQTGQPLSDGELAAVVRRVRASVIKQTATALDDLVSDVPGPIDSISLAAWDPDFPGDIATQRRTPWESRADSVMYRQVLADAARQRGWAVHPYEAKSVEAEAARLLGAQAHQVLYGPRAVLGAPWSKDHRVALAATVMAAHSSA